MPAPPMLNRLTPAAAYQAVPKASPPATAETEPQARIRRDIVDTGGTLTLRHAGRLTTSGSAEPTPEPPS